MSAVILDGKALAASIKKDLALRTTALKASGKFPGLGSINVFFASCHEAEEVLSIEPWKGILYP